MIVHIFRKDWLLLWPLVTFTALIQLSLQWVQYSYGLFGGSASLPQLITLLTITWYASIAATTVAAVQRDAIPTVDQDWLIRPLRRTDLLLAKLVFVLVTILAPMALLDFVRLIVTGFTPGAALSAIGIKEALVAVYVLVPVMALAAATSGMTELLIIGAALAFVYAAAQSLAAVTLGASSCPTCDTSVKWIQHLWQHIEVLLGAIVILSLQYYRRATALSRTLAMSGALLLALAQLPWNQAFAIQSWLSPRPGAASQVTVSVAPQAQVDQAKHVDPARVDIGRASNALLHGNLGQADQYMRGLVQTPHMPQRVELPIQIGGLKPDELLHVDRAELSLFDETSKQLYDGIATDTLTVQGSLHDDKRAAGPPSLEPFDIPDRLVGTAVRLQLRLSLTLLQVGASYEIAALGGQLRAVDTGGCATRLSSEGDAIELNCVQLRPRPICLSATLYGPNGEHNPEVLKCDPDYRPYIPSATNVLTVYGIEVPIRDPKTRYAVDPGQLSRSYVLMKTFAAQEHFVRTALAPHTRLTDYFGGGN